MPYASKYLSWSLYLYWINDLNDCLEIDNYVSYLKTWNSDFVQRNTQCKWTNFNCVQVHTCRWFTEGQGETGFEWVISFILSQNRPAERNQVWWKIIHSHLCDPVYKFRNNGFVLNVGTFLLNGIFYLLKLGPSSRHWRTHTFQPSFPGIKEKVKNCL